MRTKAYQPPPALPSGNPGGAVSDFSEDQTGSASQRIRGALIARGTSLRSWANAWAEARGRDPQATYDLLRMTLYRRLDRGRPPQGRLGAEMLADLRALLGEDLIPLDGDSIETLPADGASAFTEETTV